MNLQKIIWLPFWIPIVCLSFKKLMCHWTSSIFLSFGQVFCHGFYFDWEDQCVILLASHWNLLTCYFLGQNKSKPLFKIKYLIFQFQTYLSSDNGVMFYTLVFYSFDKHVVRIASTVHFLSDHLSCLVYVSYSSSFVYPSNIVFVDIHFHMYACVYFLNFT